MLLKELFDNPLEYKLINTTNEHGIPTDNYQFVINDKKYNVQIYKIDDFRQAGVNSSKSGIGIDFQNLSVNMNDNEGITDTGDEIKVFSTVLDIIKIAISKHKPELIAFGAHEKSRQKLYNRMISVMKSKYGYEIDNDAETQFELGDSQYYVLRKI